MVTWALLALLAVGLAALALMTLAQRAHLAAGTPPAPAVWPAVSVLKPMRGVDAGLEENLESFFALDYPAYEVVLGVDDAADPALAVARRVARRHPAVASAIVVDAARVGANPKVNNLANISRHARHDVLLISDSNVRVRPGYLRDLVANLERPGVGLVSSPIRGRAAGGLGGALEALQLNGFVMGGVAAVHRVFGGVCVVGKSMLLRRATLERIGGFRRLSRFLAEDQVCGQEVAALGERIALSSQPVDNVLGRVSVRDFALRHLRWARIRRRIAPLGYAGELLLNPVFVAAAAAAAMPGAATAVVLIATLVARSALDAASERAAGVKRPLAVYPALVLARDLVTGMLWPVPFFSRSVVWRGRRFVIGPRTLLQPVLPMPTPATRPPSLPGRMPELTEGATIELPASA
jgi:ceramide glucosyltransferase